MVRKKRYTRHDDQAILEAFEPQGARIERTARELGRTPGAIARRYHRLLAAHRGDPNVTRPRDNDNEDPTT